MTCKACGHGHGLARTIHMTLFALHSLGLVAIRKKLVGGLCRKGKQNRCSAKQNPGSHPHLLFREETAQAKRATRRLKKQFVSGAGVISRTPRFRYFQAFSFAAFSPAILPKMMASALAQAP